MSTQSPHLWRGIITEYRDRLPVSNTTPVVTLCEGGTPLIHSQRLSERMGADVYLKYEGANPTGSFKDRGMTVAISKAVEEGALIQPGQAQAVWSHCLIATAQGGPRPVQGAFHSRHR